MRSPIAIAIVLTLALVAWLASRPLLELVRRGGEAPSGAAQVVSTASEPRELPRMTVRVALSTAAPVEPEVTINGHTEASRIVQVRAETMGRVVETPVPEGASVEADTLLVRLDLRDRESRIREQEAWLAQRELDYEAARRLGAKQFQAETKVAEALAELAETRARLHEARLDLERIRVTAPFRGVLERRMVEVGDFVRVGDEVARVVELDPFIVVGNAPETVVGRFRSGQPAEARLADGSVVEGRVRYVAHEADPGTRTYRVELEVANPDGRVPAGMSARMSVRQPPVVAHRVSAAALVLADDGRIGIKAVDDEGTVRFHPAQIVRAETEALWLAGLPERLRLITTGQGFVAAGEKVRVQVVPAEAAVSGGALPGGGVEAGGPVRSGS